MTGRSVSQIILDSMDFSRTGTSLFPGVNFRFNEELQFEKHIISPAIVHPGRVSLAAFSVQALHCQR